MKKINSVLDERQEAELLKVLWLETVSQVGLVAAYNFMVIDSRLGMVMEQKFMEAVAVMSSIIVMSINVMMQELHTKFLRQETRRC